MPEIRDPKMARIDNEEKANKFIEEQIKVANHRIEDLEKAQK